MANHEVIKNGVVESKPKDEDAPGAWLCNQGTRLQIHVQVLGRYAYTIAQGRIETTSRPLVARIQVF